MIGKIFRDGECRNRKDLFLAHDSHGFIAELVGVINRGDAGTRGIKCAGLAGGVDGHSLAGSGSLFDGCAELRFCVLEGR